MQAVVLRSEQVPGPEAGFDALSDCGVHGYRLLILSVEWAG
jgi:hypothetical protein